MDPSELETLIDSQANHGMCLIAHWMTEHDPGYIPQLSRLLDQRRETYPISAANTVRLLQELGIDRKSTTVRTHRSEGCSDCQHLFVSHVDSHT